MRPIPSAMRKQIDSDVYYKTCARRNWECSGRITIEHALLYQGKQVNEMWALVPLCWYHHLGKGLDKRINEYLALRRASDADLDKYAKANWKQKYAYLKGIYDT